jgi:hypothetical protein
VAALLATHAHVSRQLLNRVSFDPSPAQIPLYLDDGRADLNINSSTIAELRLEQDDLLLLKFEWRREDELTDIRLDIGFGPLTTTLQESIDQLVQGRVSVSDESIASPAPRNRGLAEFWSLWPNHRTKRH